MKCVCTSPPLISPALYGYAALLAGTLCAYSSALLETDIRYGQLSTLQQTTLLNSNQAPLVCAHSSSALLNNRYQISDMGSSAHCNKHKEQFISVRTQQQLGTAARHSSSAQLGTAEQKQTSAGSTYSMYTERTNTHCSDRQTRNLFHRREHMCRTYSVHSTFDQVPRAALGVARWGEEERSRAADRLTC